MHQCAPAVSRLCFQAPPPFPGHLAPLTLNTEALQPTYTLSLLPTYILARQHAGVGAVQMRVLVRPYAEEDTCADAIARGAGHT